MKEYYKEHDVKQKSEEWLKIRGNRFTASEAQAIVNHDENSKSKGAGLKTLAKEKALYLYTGKLEQGYTNEDMERGNDLEDIARSLYILETGSQVAEIGFIEVSEWAGCSPDGLVEEEGLIEIKCHNDSIYFDLLLTDEVGSKYEAQMQYQMWITGRKWCDYVAYNENFGDKGLYIKRFYPNEEVFKKIEEGVQKGIDLVNYYVNMLDNVKTKRQ